MIPKRKHFVIFDLDDTLYNEIDYLKSAFFEIAQNISENIKENHEIVFDDMMQLYHNKYNVFDEILKKYNTTFSKKELLHLYRNHSPNIELSKEKKEVLDTLKSLGFKMGLLTDGRSLQQRSKIKALNIEPYISQIVISEEFGSEKPNEKNYLHFENKFGKGHFYYIGDNVSKDFVSPNKLGWTSVCILDQGKNIHKQDFNLNESFLPQITLKQFKDLLKILS